MAVFVSLSYFQQHWLCNSCLFLFVLLFQRNLSLPPVESDAYTWTWTSDIPLECVDHLARVRQFYNRSVPGSWSDWVTNYGEATLASVQASRTRYCQYCDSDQELSLPFHQSYPPSVFLNCCIHNVIAHSTHHPLGVD